MGISSSCFSGNQTAWQGDAQNYIENGNLEQLLSLVSSNPSLLEQRCFAGGNTVLHLCARSGQTNMVQALADFMRATGSESSPGQVNNAASIANDASTSLRGSRRSHTVPQPPSSSQTPSTSGHPASLVPAPAAAAAPPPTAGVSVTVVAGQPPAQTAGAAAAASGAPSHTGGPPAPPPRSSSLLSQASLVQGPQPAHNSCPLPYSIALSAHPSSRAPNAGGPALSPTAAAPSGTGPVPLPGTTTSSSPFLLDNPSLTDPAASPSPLPPLPHTAPLATASTDIATTTTATTVSRAALASTITTSPHPNPRSSLFGNFLGMGTGSVSRLSAGHEPDSGGGAGTALRSVLAAPVARLSQRPGNNASADPSTGSGASGGANAGQNVERLVNRLNARKQTPLILAASRGHAETVACLLQLGANPSIADGALGCTALHYASMYGHADVVRVLLPRVDNLDEQRVRERAEFVNCMSSSGAAALHYAADAGHADVVRLLCNRDADINCPMRPSRSLQVLLGAHAGATPLHLAADQGNVSVVLVILKYYLEQQMLSNTSVVDPRSVRDSTGMRPHQVAFLTHNFRTAMLLRPGYPLTWLFRTTRITPAPAIPSLATLAARALRAKVCSQIEATRAFAIAQASQGLTKEGKGEGTLNLARLDSLGKAGSGKKRSSNAGPGWRSGEALQKEGGESVRRSLEGEARRSKEGEGMARQWSREEIGALGGVEEGDGGQSPELVALSEFGDGFGGGMEGDVGLSARARRRRQHVLGAAALEGGDADGAGVGDRLSDRGTRGSSGSGLGRAGSLKRGSKNAEEAQGGEIGGVEKVSSARGRGGEGRGMGMGKASSMRSEADVAGVLSTQPCGVCFEEPMLGDKAMPPVVMVALQPCGHVLCAQCALQVVGASANSAQAPACPFCRRSILGAGNAATASKEDTPPTSMLPSVPDVC